MGALSFSADNLRNAPETGAGDVNYAPGDAKSDWARPLLQLWNGPAAAFREQAIGSRAEWDAPGPADPDWMQWALSRAEREHWTAMRAVEKRRREWLLGRAAVKDAVCNLIARHVGTRLAPAEVEIVPDAYGCPRATGAWTSRLGTHPAISIAHSSGTAVALAVLDGGLRAGIDLESMDRRREDFEAVAFSVRERGLLAVIQEDLRQEWALRMWCAKEAVGKALGRGLSAGLRAFRIPEIELRTGRVPVEWQGRTLTVSTTREADFVFAAIICQRGAVE